MKRTILNFILLLLFISCCENEDTVLGDYDMDIYDIKMLPAKIQRGKELTIKFNVFYDSIYHAHLQDIEVVDGQLGNNQNLVNFNLKFEENAKPYTQTKDGKISVHYENGKYSLSEAINPDKYTYYNFDPKTGEGEIRCIVPAKAISGIIKLEGLGLSNCGFSAEKLIIVDENGNEVTK